MFTIHHVLVFISYLCVRNAKCWARITKSDMEIQRYYRLKIVLAEKERTGTWLPEQMGHNFFEKRVQSRTRSSYTKRRNSRTKFNVSTVSRWINSKVQSTCGKFDLVARLSENSTRLHATSTWM